jgi:hypothetical protein
MLEALNSGRNLDAILPRFADGGLAGLNIAAPVVNVAAPAAPSVNVPAPNVSVNPQIINVSNFEQAMEAYLTGRSGQKTIVNVIGKNATSIGSLLGGRR